MKLSSIRESLSTGSLSTGCMVNIFDPKSVVDLAKTGSSKKHWYLKYALEPVEAQKWGKFRKQ